MDDCQWHTPVSHNRQQGCTRPDRKAGSLSGKITHSVTVTSPKAVCIFPNPYLPSLHLSSSSMLAFSPISHCNSSRQPVQMFWDAARRGQDTTPASGLNGEEAGEEVIRHWSRTNMNSGSMSPESEETCFFLFFFCQLMSLHPLCAITAPRMRVAPLYRELDSNLCNYSGPKWTRALSRISNSLKIGLKTVTVASQSNSGKFGCWSNVLVVGGSLKVN